MHLIILDKDFKPLAPVTTLTSLIWDRRYREPGTFELHAGPADFDGIRDGAYVYRDDRDELGIIYEANIERDKTGAKTCYAKGYFGEHMLDDRVLDRTKRLNGTPETIARQLVTDFFISPSGEGSYDGRGLDGHLELGPISEEDQESVQWQGTGSPVGSALYELEAAQGLSHRVKYDYQHDKLIFNVWRGKARNALFSDKYGNLTATSYHRDTTDAPNVVYVAGNGEGTSRKVYRLDLRNEGDAAREMYVDARDLQQDFTGEDGESYHYTDEDYEALLADRGRQKAAEHQKQERFEASVDARANLVYREDYDLGDLCLASIDGVELEKQITGIRETYEAGKETIEITLGDYGPTSIQRAVSRQAQINKEAGPPTGNVGDLNKLTTTDKTGIVPAVNEIDKDVGDLAGLETEDKSSIVNAINELKQGGSGEDSRIGDMTQLKTIVKDTVVGAINSLYDRVSTLYSSLTRQIGTLSQLKTTAKNSLVAAINELVDSGGGGEPDDYAKYKGWVDILRNYQPISFSLGPKRASGADRPTKCYAAIPEANRQQRTVYYYGAGMEHVSIQPTAVQLTILGSKEGSSDDYLNPISGKLRLTGTPSPDVTTGYAIPARTGESTVYSRYGYMPGSLDSDLWLKVSFAETGQAADLYFPVRLAGATHIGWVVSGTYTAGALWAFIPMIASRDASGTTRIPTPFGSLKHTATDGEGDSTTAWDTPTGYARNYVASNPAELYDDHYAAPVFETKYYGQGLIGMLVGWALMTYTSTGGKKLSFESWLVQPTLSSGQTVQLKT